MTTAGVWGTRRSVLGPDHFFLGFVSRQEWFDMTILRDRQLSSEAHPPHSDEHNRSVVSIVVRPARRLLLLQKSFKLCENHFAFCVTFSLLSICFLLYFRFLSFVPSLPTIPLNFRSSSIFFFLLLIFFTFSVCSSLLFFCLIYFLSLSADLQPYLLAPFPLINSGSFVNKVSLLATKG